MPRTPIAPPRPALGSRRRRAPTPLDRHVADLEIAWGRPFLAILAHCADAGLTRRETARVLCMTPRALYRWLARHDPAGALPWPAPRRAARERPAPSATRAHRVRESWRQRAERRLITLDGETRSLAEWVRELQPATGVCYGLAHARLVRLGWPAPLALRRPPKGWAP